MSTVDVTDDNSKEKAKDDNYVNGDSIIGDILVSFQVTAIEDSTDAF